jgi:hypothetical protein
MILMGSANIVLRLGYLKEQSLFNAVTKLWQKRVQKPPHTLDCVYLQLEIFL